MRLFAAIDIPDDLREVLADTVRQLKPAAKARWSKPENLHITTKFLGEVDEGRIGAVIDVLRALPSTGPIPIEVARIGWLPNPRWPRLLYAGVHAHETLGQLHLRTDQALRPLGIPAETKPFHPHLTLARIHAKLDRSELERAIAGLPTNGFGTFTAERFHLYQSLTGGAGCVYLKLAEFEI